MAYQTRDNAIEAIVNALRTMTILLVKLRDNFRTMYDLIEIEHARIKKNDLVGVENNLVDKSRIGSEIVQASEEIAAKFRVLRDVLSAHGEAHATAVNLSDIVAIIRRFADIQQGGLGDKILIYTIDQFAERLSEFALERARVVPKVEMNAYLLGRLIKQHQKIRLVFQQGIDELRSVYDARGVTASHDPLPMLQVRA